ncbi:succinyl-diaminopimelate desuccinylase [Spelaeicoccus albus]|uniref:Succinyl-diaminopimelate desuccinylase n=1 Tax=Spelaeicoccus albus TaxID=1280376 RepID=A0A7Z0II52_9MICO|nr:succinyl-diaminopimelate desuccinylase [Spelaeicoccus albus]NYI68077.1 succinyl-diaminopimelate desuccinylase [Spelaeicoccus albus]
MTSSDDSFAADVPDLTAARPLDLGSDVAELTAALCDIESVSGNEKSIADAVHSALGALAHLRVERDGDTVVARTGLGRDKRVVMAGHLDTVPVADNLPTRLEGGVLHGRGTVDMKGGVAALLSLAASLTEPRYDVTWVFYDHEEVAASLNGLGRVARRHPEWLTGDFAVLGEPTNARVEGGCNGTIRVELRIAGRRAHSGRAWMGVNAIHGAARALATLADYEAATKVVDGLAFRESLSAVAISGGVAGNVVPDECVVTVNYRFAPSLTASGAEAHLRELFAGYDLTVTDSSEGARPGLDRPEAADFLAAVGGEPEAKVGWTDVARFSALGVPAVNFGPGDPLLAHKDDERVPTEQIHAVREALEDWLGPVR